MSPEESLREAVRRLALPAKRAVEALRAEATTPDAWIRGFDEAWTLYVERLSALPDEGALVCAQTLDDALSRLSDPRLADVRSETAVAEHEVWEGIRHLAGDVVDAFGWDRA